MTLLAHRGTCCNFHLCSFNLIAYPVSRMTCYRHYKRETTENEVVFGGSRVT